MFAFAVLDETQNKITLARDRYGIKPLYWYWKEGRFVFGSEVKAILKHPRVKRDVCLPALNEYFTFQNILTDLTLFEGIRLLPPAATLVLSLTNSSEPVIQRYWDFSFQSQPQWTSDECENRLYDTFTRAVKRQLVSDVPLGAYLSGGVDSGSIVAVARQNLGRLKTFTGGFDLSSASGLELAFDERAQSEVLSNLLKTEHYEMVMHAGDMENAMPSLIWHLEDLRVGQSYPNFYVARLAGKFVKVVLSGTGGDEIFGGYPWRYYTQPGDSAEVYYKNYYSFWQRLVPDEEKAQLFTSDIYRHVRDHSTFDTFKRVFNPQQALQTPEDLLNASLYFELKTFLHGLLVVEDKLSMAHSLETRLPFLDNELVDLALKIPASMKLKDFGKTISIDENLPVEKRLYQQKTNHGKSVLRKSMARLIPTEITERAKQGFSAPDASWFRGESIDYVHRLFHTPHSSIYDFLSKEYVLKIFNQHCSGQHNHRLFIWSVLCFGWWLRQFMED
jgi:asparagine synthase (glutamine-hydrolysing)